MLSLACVFPIWNIFFVGAYYDRHNLKGVNDMWDAVGIINKEGHSIIDLHNPVYYQ